MTVEVVMPWRGGCEHRAKALRWVSRCWRETHPEWSLRIVEPPAGPWVKALAVMPAIVKSTADVFVVADADVWCDDVATAVAAVAEGAAWAVPHGEVHRLDLDATTAVYGGLTPDQVWGFDEPPYYGVEAGGLIVIRRDVALDVPLDPRFAGWGGEDHAWGFALSTLYPSAPRGKAPLWHLWHPPAPRITRLIGSRPSEALRRRYSAARVRSDAMRRIVAEVPRPWLSNDWSSSAAG